MTVQSSAAEVEQVLLPAVRNLGDGFKVRRALPSAQRRMVGPFIFLDSFGPVAFRAGEGLDARPHPHIGLATLTYLIDGARYRIDQEHVERAVYVASGAIEIAGQSGSYGKDRLVVFKPGAEIVLRASGATRLMLLGGEPVAEKRHIYWNFVSSRRERIEQAARAWRDRRFPGVPGETEFIPIPDAPPFRAA